MRARVPWPKPGDQPDEPDEVNEPDDSHLVPVKQGDGTIVWCEPEAVDHWRPELWR